jgi:cell division septation protein DedD
MTVRRALVMTALTIAAAVTGAATPSALAAQSTRTDTIFARAQQLAGSGEGNAGRAIVDSVLAATPPGTNEYAEALYWRALLAVTIAEAERDYLRVSIEYAFSPRATDALLRLGQLELARNDRARAQRHLEQAIRNDPSSPAAARAGATLARLLLEGGDTAAGCAALATARPQLDPTDIELRHQLDYYAPRCANLARAAAAAADSQVVDSAAAPAAATTPTDAVSDRPAGFSVQVAAYSKRADADALARRLKNRGFDVRVAGRQAPYRVRVGRYATRADAEAARGRMRRAKIDGIVVDAEPR